MSGNPPPSSDPYGRQQYSYSGRILLTTAVILFALTVVFVVLRILVHALQLRAGGGRARRGGGLAAGILRSISGIGSSRRGLDASALSALPVTSYRKEVVAAGAGGADCAVCLSELADGDKVRELPNCGHAFHVECVDAWLRAKSTCPLCRADVEMQQGNGKAEAQSSSSSSSSAAATEPLPQPALFGAGGTLMVTVHGGSDSRRDVRGSTSG
ncbi:E3 ubiquitin-protein ligase EL5-like [Lolium rigidum]|uniref:E3 ubiquitin-protein ligase EL5-like n=1 Tax=Lolium rigidum TaxID=89674 RepID=UPI001F5C784C|nr:E3 ubiquitin-protein ligase EL5-like [Lolium rigidum]XP_051206481.1 E3 ubiquitin-protein ligase EL5-like [Lolium perenne]